MNRISTLARCGFMALAVVAVGAALLAPSKASAQFPPPPPPPPAPPAPPLPPPPPPPPAPQAPLEVNITIYEQRVDKQTIRVKVVIVAEIKGVVKNTTETEWIYLKRGPGLGKP